MQVLSMRALVKSISAIPISVSDPGVALAKLAWWQNEWRDPGLQQSQHPLLRAIVDSDLTQQLSSSVVDECLHQLASAIDRPAPSSMQQFADRALSQAGSAALMFVGVPINDELESAVRAGGAAELLLHRLEVDHHEPVPDWIPMDMVARYSLRRRGPGTEEPRLPEELIKLLAGKGIDWSENIGTDSSLDVSLLLKRATGRYWLLYTQLVRNRLAQWARHPGRRIDKGPAPGVSEVFSAWLSARRIYSRKPETR